MTRLSFSATWTAPPEDEAVGPEVPTWARMELCAGDIVLTRHRPYEPFISGEAPIDDSVEGPLSGLAEWVVDNFAQVLWESHVPVAKHGTTDGGRTRIPDLRQASRWWPTVPSTDVVRVASWQQRHTLGAATTQLALPSLVFVPEVGRIGLFAAPLPTELDPNVVFLPQDQTEFWLERDDLRESLVQLVEGTLAAARKDASSSRWTEWLTSRWEEAKRREASDAERKRLLFGDVVASLWEKEVEPLGSRKTIVEGVLADVAEVRSVDAFKSLLGALALDQRHAVGKPKWKDLASKPRAGARAFDQGYELARKVRKDLKLGLKPIDRMDVLLSGLDVEDRAADSGGLFRTACCVNDRFASVIVSDELRGLAARRVALASSLGRLLFEARGSAWGAAISDQSRWEETRRAGAFSAELLAPADAVREEYLENPEGLAEDYGISLASAKWRIHNVVNPS